MRYPLLVVTLLLAAGPAWAFNGHAVERGPLKLVIGELADVTAYDTPYDVPVTLENRGKEAVSVRLQVAGLVDEWRAVGETAVTVEVGPGKAAAATFRVAAGRGRHSALYPVRVVATPSSGGPEASLVAIRVFETRFPEAERGKTPQEFAVQTVPDAGALPLLTVPGHRVTWHQFGREPVQSAVGWQGSDKASGASCYRRRIDRGGVRDAIDMHPPYRGGAGTIFAEYRLRLPATQPLRLVFANAIRDHHPPEPASDGVTFRVWVGEDKVFERHTDSKTWVEGEADLSPYAGQEVLLRLESHPGPKQNTTCDSSHWAAPTVVAGPLPALEPQATRQKRFEAARSAVAAPKEAGPGVFAFALADGYAAAVVPGPNGLADAAMAFGRGDRAVVLDGMAMEVEGAAVGAWPPETIVEKVEASRDASTGRLTLVHRGSRAGERFDLTAEIWADGPGLRVKLACPALLTDLAPGPADRTAPVVIYGHGYRVVEPEAFQVHAGGHSLSTSHVGFEFADGPSLLVATDRGPDTLRVDPARKVYALHAHEDTTFTFVPSVAGALDAAIRYRPLCRVQPAPGVGRKAGRFVFDIWGGRYAENVRHLRQAVAYGLTDALYMLHVWQRWGYDYRLPDIWPPDPRQGTLEDLQDLAGVCREAGIPWGLHDNYIDFYPDAEGYSYEHICFNERGGPIKAWINEGRDAQSYRWRPDAFQPFLARNLRLIKTNLAPTASFVDVFASMGGFDFWDRGGTFHPKSEALRCWGEAFDTIRETLDGAITVSEAGGDHLIGHLDGADCQFLQLASEHLFHYGYLPCKAWQQVPWFDAVHHRRFSLHGVGYSDRYQGMRSRRGHGIESDDYLTSEMLLGHALMMDRGGMVRGAVRKYWLAQDFIRAIADADIVRVEFADGDPERQVVRWSSGAVVHVNRGTSDWQVVGRTLPPFGYHAACGPVESCIEKRDGAIVEWSKSPGRFYANGRGTDPGRPLRIRPSAGDLEHLGDRRFRLPIHWDVEAAPASDLHTFVHFVRPAPSRLQRNHFYAGSNPKPPTSQWTGRVTTDDHAVAVPDDCPPGRYDVLVGLWDPKSRRRMRLLGEEFDAERFRVGTIIVEGRGDRVTGIRLEKPASPPQADPYRGNLDGRPIDFGPAVTSGALRCERLDGDTLRVTPLPGEEAVRVTVRLGALLEGERVATEVVALDAEGKECGKVVSEAAGGAVTFTTRPEDFAYRVVTQRHGFTAAW